MFEATAPFLFFDYFRIPYQIVPDAPRSAIRRPTDLLRAWGQLDVQVSGSPTRTLYWPRHDANGHAHESPRESPPRLGYGQVEGVPISGRILPHAQVAALVHDLPGNWMRTTPIRHVGGETVTFIWRDDRGNWLVPFDPGEIIRNYWSEAYQRRQVSSLKGWLKRAAMRSYYQVRPMLPRATQIRLRRAFSRVQARARFPRWPVEPALHDFYDFLFSLTAEFAGTPVPWLSPWPAGYSWAMVLTHDVETDVGLANLDRLRDVEVAAGYRSSWNFVPKRYAVDRRIIQRLAEAGFEVGVHGLYHDGRDLESPDTLQKRLPAMRSYADRWGATGFRSPATHRDWTLMPLLGFDYDSSYPDTDPYEPQSGGCCSWLPFFNREMVELPITLPQDHTLFTILAQSDERTWTGKTNYLRSRGGMALLNTHPDYMLDEPRVQLYARFLARYREDPSAWRALPRDVSAWWRRRAASRLERIGGQWTVTGPAASEGTIRFTSASEATDLGRTDASRSAHAAYR